MDDDDDEAKRFHEFYKKMKRMEEWEQQLAAKKMKNDSTSSPPASSSPNGGKITSVRKDFTKSTSSPSPNGGKPIHALIKQTPVKKNLTSSPSPDGEQIMKVVRKTFTKPTSSPSASPNGEKLQALIKPPTLPANSQRKGKEVVSTEATREVPIFADVSAETSRRPFVRKWYNGELEREDKETWDMFNGCFRAIHSKNTKGANFCLSQLEKSHTSLKNANYILEKKFGEVQQLVSRLVSYSSTSRSEMLNAKERDLFSERRKLKSILSQLQTADLVNLRIEDFLELVKALGVQSDRVEELESKAKVLEMTNVYQQHLIDDQVFFQLLEEAKMTRK